MAARRAAVIGPTSARHARLLRLANQLAAQGAPGVPKSDADKMIWVNSQVNRAADQKLSELEERQRAKLIPTTVGEKAFSAHGQTSQGNLYAMRDYPMYPGEYVPAGHDTLSDLRDELKLDLAAQNIKNAWMSMTKGKVFLKPGDFYASTDGVDEGQLVDVVTAMYPTLSEHESAALVRRVFESISAPHANTASKVSRVISAEAVGLDDAPQHYSNFLEWMARMMDTKAFKTEHAIFQFCRRKFNKRDVVTMYENLLLLTPAALKSAQADGYSHFHAILKDFIVKISGEDTRHQLGVRIDPAEVDPKHKMSFGFGKSDDYEVSCMLRENIEGTGSIFYNGRPLSRVMENRSWLMEMVMYPMDEAGLSFSDFDVYFVNRGKQHIFMAQPRVAAACQLALGNAITKMMPITRVPLKKAGVLSFDRRRPLGQHRGFLGGKMRSRVFRKR